MRFTEFVYGLIDRFAPMQEVDKAALRNDANLDYIKIRMKYFDEGKKELKEGLTFKTLPLQGKLVFIAEHWITRTVLALLFIGCLRWVQDFVRPDREEEDEPEYEIVD